MKIIRSTSAEEIEQHLLALGGGNQVDNMKKTREHSNFYLVELNEEEFFELVFLDNNKMKPIVPDNSDRRLKAVSIRAGSELKENNNVTYDDNWDLRKNMEKFNAEYNSSAKIQLPELLIIDATGSEKNFGAQWYLQDGCHRALAYTIEILKGKIQYSAQQTYCATNRDLLEL